MVVNILTVDSMRMKVIHTMDPHTYYLCGQNSAKPFFTLGFFL